MPIVRTVYETEDGRVFSTEAEAQAHEGITELADVLTAYTLLSRSYAVDVAEQLMKAGLNIVRRDSLPHTDE